ncbi:MAG: hypothetical protein RB191_13755 [Terriglobia bacterium]|nr:hypothetical protein [Terriglobia bacterium]
MIEQEIAALVTRDCADLRGLEADMWRRESKKRTSQRAVRTLASLQAAVVAVSVISSAAAGVAEATTVRVQAQPASLFNPGADLAPSSLLFGKRP